MPSVDGTITAKLHGDTMGIPKGTEHPDEAVEVLLWMMSPEIAPKLAAIYGGIPARTSAQQPYITDPANDFGFSWDVALDALELSGHPEPRGMVAGLPGVERRRGGLVDGDLQRPECRRRCSIDQLCGILQPIYDRATS